MYKNTNVQKKGKGEITFLIKVSTTFYKKKKKTVSPNGLLRNTIWQDISQSGLRCLL